jgi:hypothetical protein
MAHFTSVRGWIQLFSETTKDVTDVITAFKWRASEYGISPEDAELYLQGWVPREKQINWSSYVFYGADVRTQAVPFLEDLVKEIAEKISYRDGDYVSYPRGVFHVDSEDNDNTVIWRIAGGRFEKRKVEFLFPEEFDGPPKN